ncbi:MAG: hypothetical protein ACOC2W_04285 [bacterium]
MSNVPDQIRKVKKQIAKLEKTFKGGVPKYYGFTIDLCYGGNKEPDIERISLGGVAGEEQDSKQFYDLVLKSLKLNLKFWENEAKRQIKELQECLLE